MEILTKVLVGRIYVSYHKLIERECNEKQAFSQKADVSTLFSFIELFEKFNSSVKQKQVLKP